MGQCAEPRRVSYRAFVVNEHGRLGGVPQVIVAVDDTDAARQVEDLVGRYAVEIWEGSRLVARVDGQSKMPRHHA